MGLIELTSWKLALMKTLLPKKVVFSFLMNHGLFFIFNQCMSDTINAEIGSNNKLRQANMGLVSGQVETGI